MILVLSQRVLTGNDTDQPPSPGRIQQWIADLGSSEFKTRELATQQLINAGGSCTQLLKRAAQGDDAEVVWRSKHILFHGPRKRVLVLLRQAEFNLMAGLYKLAQRDALAAAAVNTEHKLLDETPELLMWLINIHAREAGVQSVGRPFPLKLSLSVFNSGKIQRFRILRKRIESEHRRLLRAQIENDRKEALLRREDAVMEKLGPLEKLMMSPKAREISRLVGMDD